MKNQYRGGDRLIRGLRQSADSRRGRGLSRKKGVVFLRGGWYPNGHYVYTYGENVFHRRFPITNDYLKLPKDQIRFDFKIQQYGHQRKHFHLQSKSYRKKNNKKTTGAIKKSAAFGLHFLMVPLWEVSFVDPFN